MFVAGGRTVEDHIILAIEQYDVITGVWTNPFNWTAEDATSDGGLEYNTHMTLIHAVLFVFTAYDLCDSFGWQNKLFLVGGYNSDYQ